MPKYKNLLVLDLTSYGAAFAVLNRFVDDEQVKVFEISPIGQKAVLMLLLQDEITATILQKEIKIFFSNEIISSGLIINFDQKVLETYLSQKQEAVLSQLCIAEFSVVSDAFLWLHRILKQNINLVDFRIIRTSLLNVIITISSNDSSWHKQIEQATTCGKLHFIDKVEAVTRSYFELT